QLEGGTRPEVNEAMEGGELLHLPVHRLDHIAAAVADVGVPQPGGGVEIAVAYLVVHVHPFGPVHDERGVLDGVHVREGVPESAHTAEGNWSGWRAALACKPLARARVDPDSLSPMAGRTVIVNAMVFRADSARTWARAVAVENGR